MISLDALFGWLQAYDAFDRMAMRVLNGTKSFMYSLVGEAIEPPLSESLTIRAFSSRGSISSQKRELFDWERSWYQESLPEPPASVLLGGAGFGREARWLASHGYHVTALEPVSTAAASCLEAVGGSGTAVRASYGDLVDAAANDAKLTALLGRERFDAIILGWGSLTHVIHEQEQHDLLKTCDLLAGSGPILASFWMRPGVDVTRSRAAELGAKLGHTVRQVCGGSPRWRRPGVSFSPAVGFGYYFCVEDIERLGVAIGLEVIWGLPGQYPHVCFVRRQPSGTDSEAISAHSLGA